MMNEGVDFDLTNFACDEDVSRILAMTNSMPRCVKDISSELRIPISRCYRRINEMLDRGMLFEVGTDPNNAVTYESNLRSMQILLEDHRLWMKLEFKDGMIKKGEYKVRTEE